MFKNLLLTGLKTAIYAAIPVVIGLLIAMVQHLITTFQPSGEVQLQLWQILIIPAMAGLVKVLKRLLTWDPAKVGK